VIMASWGHSLIATGGCYYGSPVRKKGPCANGTLLGCAAMADHRHSFRT
jgi:hypothetical protein